jgi:hypothetical protein
VPGLILAAVSPDNTPHGYNWTFAFPMLLFIVVALVLYALFARPHRRVPGRPIAATSTSSRVPGSGAARAAAVEPAVPPTTTSEPGGAHMTGSVNPADSGGTPPEDGESEPGTGASE